jgi:hypothetical protein
MGDRVTIIDPSTSPPGLPRPVQTGTAWYVDREGRARSAPIYLPSAATNGQRIQAEDVGAGWTLVREEPVPTDPAHTADERLDAARSALQAIDALAAPVLPVDVLDVLTDLRTALEP